MRKQSVTVDLKTDFSIMYCFILLAQVIMIQSKVVTHSLATALAFR